MQMVDRVHQILTEYLKPGDRAVDATVGNGWDTLKLCELVGDTGKVYGFDIQPDAIKNTREKLKDAGYENRAELFCTSHSQAGEWVKEPIKAFVMNLGYLPGGDKNIVTCRESTLKAIETLMEFLTSGGVGTILVYYGHEGGREEKSGVEVLMASIPAGWGQITRMEIVNRKNSPPILYILEKK